MSTKEGVAVAARVPTASHQRVRCVLDIIATKQRDKCPVPGQHQRKTNCRCLGDLVMHHRELASEALDFFCSQLREKIASGSGKPGSFVDKHVRGSQSTSTPLNHASHPDYELPVTAAGHPVCIVLCRGAMIELMQLIIGMTADDAKQLFPSQISLARKQRKRNLFRILRYFMENPDQGRTSWHRALRGTGLSTSTAKYFRNHYDLQAIASRCIMRVDKHQDWIRNNLGGLVCHVPDAIVNKTFPQFKSRGRQPADYKNVHKNSVGCIRQHYDSLVRFRTVDRVDNKNDKRTFDDVEEHLKPIIANTLNTPEEMCSIVSAYLVSQGFAPQVCHYDFVEKDRLKLQGNIHLGLCPLTKSGCYLQAWPRRENPGALQHGVVLFIPKGRILLLPGDTIHGGGFVSDDQTQDLRLHFYIYTNGEKPKINHNEYLSLEEYPHSPHLQPGELLDRVFTSDST